MLSSIVVNNIISGTIDSKKEFNRVEKAMKENMKDILKQNMKIFTLKYRNNYSLNRTFSVLADNVQEAKELLLEDEEIKKYIQDEDTKFDSYNTIEINKPIII